MEKGGNIPCVLNAANEIVVDAFLKEKVGFLSMSNLISKHMQVIANNKVKFMLNLLFRYLK